MTKFLRTSLGISVAIVAGAAMGQTPPPTPPQQRLTLNDRVFLNTADVYDPTYGLLRVGYIKDNVLTYLPLNENIRKFRMPSPTSRNFIVYRSNSDEGYEGNVSIPVIGGISAAKDQVVYASMEDIISVAIPPGVAERSTCQIWDLIKPDLIPAGSTIMYTDYAVFSKLTAGAGSKQAADAKVGIGNFFSAGGGTYKSSDTETKVPLISVQGYRFTVTDPKTFCKGNFEAPAKVRFESLRELTDSKSLQFNTIDSKASRDLKVTQ